MKQKAYLLATDLDHTFVGDPLALENLLDFFKDRQFDPALVYVTGRHLDSALSLMEQESLPKPDILVTDVGTAIYHAPDWTEDRAWRESVDETWLPDKILSALKDVPSIVLQDLPHQKRISYTVQLNQPHIVDTISERLDAQHIPYHLVYSSGRDLEILPERSGKGKAVQYILDQYAKEDVGVLLAGDSGNDAEMLLLDYPAVMVGNAQEELKQLLPHPLLYRAEGHYAGGIQEAWNHFYRSNHE